MKNYLLIGLCVGALAACQPKDTVVKELKPVLTPETTSMTKTASEAAAEQAAAEEAAQADLIARQSTPEALAGDTGMMCLASPTLANDYVTLIPAGVPGKLDGGKFTYNGNTYDISNTNFSAKPC